MNLRVRFIELVIILSKVHLVNDKVEEVLKWNTQLNTWKIKRLFRLKLKEE